MDQISLFPTFARLLSVSEITRHIRATLEGDEALQDVWVEGEVSNISRPGSGHIYFTLKDAGAALRCVMWRTVAARQSYLPRGGEAVEVHGRISVYEAGGQYQLYADLIRPVGEGRLYQEFLRLKERLEAEGLFAPERKRAIPRRPQVVGIVTSPTGAALQDMVNTLRRRYPLARAVLAPTPVQGDEAPAGIVAALEALNQRADPDVILLARGGGSIEDLWAFNDERVARAVAASTAPVITGIGHETDFTIADFTADLRAPTPTAAAELATPHVADLHADLEEIRSRLQQAAGGTLGALERALESLHARLAWRSPQAKVQTERQRLDELVRRGQTALDHCLRLERTRLAGFHQRLESLNPAAVLGRGFAVVTHPDGQLVSRTAQARAGQPLRIRVKDGAFKATSAGPEEPGPGGPGLPEA